MVRYNQSGYSGSSRSNGAVTAEHESKLPLTRATRAVAHRANVTQKRAKESLIAVEPCEWHHTSKYANRTDYYSVDAALGWLIAQSMIPRLPPDWEKRIDNVITYSLRCVEPMQTRHARVEGVLVGIADEAGIDTETIRNLYYELYEEIQA